MSKSKQEANTKWAMKMTALHMEQSKLQLARLVRDGKLTGKEKANARGVSSTDGQAKS